MFKYSMYLYKTYHKIIEELKVYNTCNGSTLLIFRNKVELHISLYIIKPMKYFNGKKRIANATYV